MAWVRGCAVTLLAAFTFVALPAVAQSVISTHSGLVHYFDGAVYVNDQPLEPRPGKFPTVPQGAELRTAEGRAEVLLTPGVFLRVGARSAIRMVSNQLSDTRVELLAGSAIVDSIGPGPGTSVTLLFRNWSFRASDQGVYRIDADPPRLWVIQGKAEVSTGTKQDARLIGPGMDVQLESVLTPTITARLPHDALSQWAEGRQQSIFADNTIAANIQDPANLTLSTPGFDSFTYFPMLGLPSRGPGSSVLYSSVDAYQPGFNSVYFPGYAFFPGYVYLPLGLLSAGGYVAPVHQPYHGGLPIGPARYPYGSPTPVRPISPYSGPSAPFSPRPGPVAPASPRPVPIHPVSPSAGHPVGHH